MKTEDIIFYDEIGYFPAVRKSKVRTFLEIVLCVGAFVLLMVFLVALCYSSFGMPVYKLF